MKAATADAQRSPLERPVNSLYGVGPERAALLARLEIRTVEDLLLHRPRRYEDRTHLARIADLHLGEPVICYGKVVALGVKWFRHRSKSVFEMILDDSTARLHCRWWNLPFMERYFKMGDEVLVFGRPLQLKPRTMDHPETEVLEAGEENFVHLNRLTPIYPLTEGLPQRWLRSLIWKTLQTYEAAVGEPFILTGSPTAQSPAAKANQPLALWPTLPSRARAFRLLHFPEAEEQIELARRRLALDEFVQLQLGIQERRNRFTSKSKALPCSGDNHFIRPFLAALGFRLTDAQTAVLREVRKDMSGQHPMRRLLQGDVGSGKTVVAACCALMCLESGFHVALMVPTEILAEQHFLNFSRWFGPLGICVELRTGSHKPASSDTAARAGQPAGTPAGILTIGTHALLEPGYHPERLGLAIIDEQHKFGVIQREQLVRKGHYPHLLVMTATPIPRTLGLTLYGELDVSTITTPPANRGRIRTFVRTADKLPQVWDFIRGQLQQGRQAFVVYPRVQDSGEADAVKAVTREFSNIREQLAPFQAALLHGRIAAPEKEQVMSAFRANRVQVLVATSLIEVGVDVPNATVMLIENAEQFGLAQLHQIRGRIGRGAHESYCILVSQPRNREAERRLRTLEQTNDGFEIAEVDLKLRGPGELLGREQSGMPSFRFGDLARDLALIQEARLIALRLSAGKRADAPKGNRQGANVVNR